MFFTRATIIPLIILFIDNCCPYKQKLEKSRIIGMEAVNIYAPPLLKNLTDKVNQEGIEKTIEFCAGFSPDYETSKNREIYSVFTEKYGIKSINIKRTSLKIRNPKNSPDHIEKEVLGNWTGETKNKPAEPASMYKNGVYYFLSPIRISSGICLSCHGTEENRDKNVYQKILTKYPGDKAVGYSPQDIRGAFSVTIEF